jgi:type IV secretory pathway VirB2 component (pilin)
MKNHLSKLLKVPYFLIVLSLILIFSPESCFATDGTWRQACNKFILLIEGAFGALVSVIFAVLAIIYLFLERFKSFLFLISVAICSFIFRSFITLFSGDC